MPELVDAMAHEDRSILPVTLTQSGTEALPSFYAGDVAMTVQGSFQAANIAADAPEDLDWVVLPPLEGPAGPWQAANPQTLSVNIDSEHVEESAAFIEFFTSTDNLAALNEADSLIPATTSAREVMGSSLEGENGWDAVLASGEYLESSPYLFVDAYAQWKDTVATPPTSASSPRRSTRTASRPSWRTAGRRSRGRDPERPGAPRPGTGSPGRVPGRTSGRARDDGPAAQTNNDRGVGP
ncbi:extracellular solute-binding protein [Nocardiopsis sp. ARC36]